jgi:hypothetical protein
MKIRMLTTFLLFLGSWSSLADTDTTPSTDQKINYVLFVDEPSPQVSDISKLSAWDRQLKSKVSTDKLKEAMVGAFFPLLGGLQGSFIDGHIDIKKIILQAVMSLKTSLQKTLQEVDNDLSEQPEHFFMAYLPWDFGRPLYPDNERAISFTGFKIGGDFVGRPDNFNEIVLRNIQQIIQQNFNLKTSPFYFIGAIIDLKLQRGQSNITIDVILGLTPRQFSLGTKASNEQVNLTHLVVPAVQSAEEAPITLIKLVQDFEASSNPTAQVGFGPFGGWNKSANGFVIADDGKNSIARCGNRHHSTIYLQGELKAAAAPGIAGYFADGKAIDFRLYDLTLDLAKTQVDRLNIYSSVGLDFGKVRKTFGCFKSKDIDTQFQTEINNQIIGQLGALQEKITVDGLINLLLSKVEGN